MKLQERLLTRRELVELVRNEFGIPLTESRINKDAMAGLAPQPAAYYGKHHLYRRADGINYAQSLLTPKPRRLTGSRAGRLDETADRGAS